MSDNGNGNPPGYGLHPEDEEVHRIEAGADEVLTIEANGTTFEDPVVVSIGPIPIIIARAHVPAAVRIVNSCEECEG